MPKARVFEPRLHHFTSLEGPYAHYSYGISFDDQPTTVRRHLKDFIFLRDQIEQTFRNIKIPEKVHSIVDHDVSTDASQEVYYSELQADLEEFLNNCVNDRPCSASPLWRSFSSAEFGEWNAWKERFLAGTMTLTDWCLNETPLAVSEEMDMDSRLSMAQKLLDAQEAKESICNEKVPFKDLLDEAKTLASMMYDLQSRIEGYDTRDKDIDKNGRKLIAKMVQDGRKLEAMITDAYLAHCPPG
eukprot:TRINITY_DN7993_c0_g1::TRINITY_DN7993_c0_g1_i1::g.15525::m.15525 TRINITY_DN7993_c0_g1::TRINITY_DN7993_c0_g1_i1::g.15525  ORF type:complete len:243 (-),score=38.22,PX/PF00787.19/4.7e-08 TRINITY_DN7993_c0_g1_i1:975-1703(-)